MNKVLFLRVLLIVVFFAGTTIDVFAQQAAEKATAGTGKYRDMIYWLKWDMRKRTFGSKPENDIIKIGDYVEFTAPESGMKYRVTVTNMSFPWNWDNMPKVLKAGNYNNYWLNNFQATYYWPCPGDGSAPCSKPWSPGNNAPTDWEDKKIALLVDKCEVIFDLKITASFVGNGAVIKDFAFIVAGSESLATPGGDPVREEYYSLEILPNDGETTLQEDQIVQPVEAYKQVLNSGSDWSLKLESLFGTESGTNTVKGAKLKVTNPNPIGGDNGNGQGDLLLAATHVQKVRVGLKGGGSQHIALGIIDLLDFGDAPNTYETDPANPAKFAKHYTLPSLGGKLKTEDKTWTTEPSVEDFVQLEEPILGIGKVIDSEEKKQNPSAQANGDDATGLLDNNGAVINDEDGIPGTKWFKNCAVPIKVHNHHHSKTAWLYTWFDENNNGVFDGNDALPKIEVEPGFDGYKYFDFNTLLPGFNPKFGDKRIVRFRISYNKNLGLGDLSTSGEVEDHLIEFMVPVVTPAKKSVTCDEPTTTVSVLNLPQTGWTITQTGKKGNVLSSVNASATYTGTTTETTLTLSQGSYHLEISNNAENCGYEFDVLITGDSDCDGIPDNIDLDDDNDGILDTAEGLQDADGDGIPDDRDDDSSTEMITITTGYDDNGNPITEMVMKGSLIGDLDGIVNDSTKGRDTDSDGIPDYLDLDSDNDGCPDAIEGGTNNSTDTISEDDLVDAGGTVTVGTGSSAENKNLCGGTDCVYDNGVPKKVDENNGQVIGGSQVKMEYEITLQPADVTVCEKNTAEFTAKVTSNPSENLNYKWQVSTDNGNTWNDETATGASGTVASGTEAVLSLSNVNLGMNDNKYRVIYTHDDNTCGIESAEGTLKVHPKPKFTAEANNANCNDGESEIKVTITSDADDYEFWLLLVPGTDKIKLKKVTGVNTYRIDDTGFETNSLTKDEVTANKKITILVKASGTYRFIMKNKNAENCKCKCTD